MMSNSAVWWCITFLSALLYNLAFLFPEICGLLVIPSMILLVVQLNQRKGLIKVLCWGFSVFSVQLWWVFLLLRNFASCESFTVVFIYSALVLYFSSTLVFFAYLAQVVVSFFSRQSVRLSLISIFLTFYFYLLEYAGACFVGYKEGYPFISPLIPLAESRWFIGCVCFVSAWFNGPNYFGTQLPACYRLVYCPPVVSKKVRVSDSYLQTPSAVAQAIFHRLNRLNLNEKMNQDKKIIVVSPESSFPFLLNQHPVLSSFWSQALPQDAHFLVGGHYEELCKQYQAVFWSQNGLIKKNYVKTHRVAFVERIPRFWKSIPKICTLFKKDLTFFSRFSCNNLGDHIFQIDENCIIIPQICSEFFLKTDCAQFIQLKSLADCVVIFFFVNDSWFSPSFQKIMQLRARLQAAWIGLPLVYVGHEKLFFEQ